MAKVVAALSAARKVTELPRGRFPIEYARDGISTSPSSWQTRAVATLLNYDVLLRAQDEDPEGSLESCRAILNCARAIGNEPIFNSQLTRLACRSMAVYGLERSIAQGEPSAAALAALQSLLEKEETEPVLRIAVRGQRAEADWVMNAVQQGEVTPEAVFKAQGHSQEQIKSLRYWGIEKEPEVVWRSITNQRAGLLRWYNQAVEATKLPVAPQDARLQQLVVQAKKAPPLVVVFRSVTPWTAKLFHRNQARLRCAIVAVAAERHRRERGGWPKSLAALVAAGYLPAIPTDPLDGLPLRWKPLADGVVIYTIGEDGKDDGGKLDWMAGHSGHGVDYGVRLWDAGRRRQPPLPPAPNNPPAPEGVPPEEPPVP
jgi:hypothetical protein